MSKLGRALLGSGLLAVTLLGGAGGYGIGWLTSSAASESTTGKAVPLAAVSPSTSPTSPTSTSTEPPPKTPKPDNSPPLPAADLSYKTREFIAEKIFHSKVTVKVPRNWKMTQPDPQDEARFTDPTAKRWIRVEAGFSITRPPEDSMAARVALLNQVPSSQALKIISQEVDPKARTATLTYTYIPDETTRYVIVRWAALDPSGNVAVEMSSTGLPQDRPALLDVLDHATNSVTRTDSPL